jgi:hypothetical protein
MNGGAHFFEQVVNEQRFHLAAGIVQLRSGSLLGMPAFFGIQQALNARFGVSRNIR